MKKSTGTKQQAGYLLVLFLSVFLLFAGNRFAVGAGAVLPPFANENTITVKVTSITSRQDVTDPGFDGSDPITSTEIHFLGEVISGPMKGQVLPALQEQDYYTGTTAPDVERGDRVVIFENPDPSADALYLFSEYERTRGAAVFCLIFLLLLLVFGRIKGFNTIVALLFTCGAVFLVFLPLVLAGANIYLCAVLICIYVVTSTLLLVDGFSRKTLVAICGCAAGVLTAAALALLLADVLKLSGLTTQETIFLVQLGNIDLVGVVFAGIIIGAMGAVMDVAMSVASALSELHEKVPDAALSSLFSSGINIGRDMMSTMANTLVLAYIGSSLTTVLLLTSYASSVMQLLNLEMIITEILQAVIGSMAILLTIPLTSLIAAWVYTRKAAPAKKRSSKAIMRDLGLSAPEEE